MYSWERFSKNNNINLYSKKVDTNKLGTHKILTESQCPIATKYRRYTDKENEIIKCQLDEWLDKGIIRKSSSPWRSPIVIVPKKDGGSRICNDYRKLNAITIKDSYPLPWIEDIFDAFSGSTVFSKMDAKSGYHQVDLQENDKEKTAFGCKYGIFEYNKMPFGLVNGPATFQRIMDEILQPYLWKFVVVYLDDIIVFSKNIYEHRKHLKLVQNLLNEKGLVLNHKKCEYMKEKLEILGHIVSKYGIKPTTGRIEIIKKLKIPRDKKELQSFLGLINYCRKFIKDLSKIAAPLFGLLKDEIKKEIFMKRINEPDIISSFNKIKEEISKDVVLSIPNKNGLFILTTDASKAGIGAVLSQVQNGKEKIISFYSSGLSDIEKKYGITELELLAVIKSIKHFKHYLLNRKFKLRTDHKALVYLTKYKDNNSRLFRWSLMLQEFEFSIEYIKGIDNSADVLSRDISCNSIKNNKRERIEPSTEDQMKICQEYHKITGLGGESTMKYHILKNIIRRMQTK